MGNITHTNDGKTVSNMGNGSFYVSGEGNYMLSGGNLFSPRDGIISRNVKSLDEAEGIVIGRHGGRRF